jgi:hypothetical protein
MITKEPSFEAYPNPRVYSKGWKHGHVTLNGKEAIYVGETGDPARPLLYRVYTGEACELVYYQHDGSLHVGKRSWTDLTDAEPDENDMAVRVFWLGLYEGPAGASALVFDTLSEARAARVFAIQEVVFTYPKNRNPFLTGEHDV